DQSQGKQGEDQDGQGQQSQDKIQIQGDTYAPSAPGRRSARSPGRRLGKRAGAAARAKLAPGNQEQPRGDAAACCLVCRLPAARRRRAGARFRGLAAMDTSWANAGEIAAAVAEGRTSASAVVTDALSRIAARNGVLNAFTAVVRERALDKAHAIDA